MSKPIRHPGKPLAPPKHPSSQRGTDDPHITIKDPSSLAPANNHKLVVLPIDDGPSRKYYGFGGEHKFPPIDQEPQFASINTPSNFQKTDNVIGRNQNFESLPSNLSGDVPGSNIYVGDNRQPLSLYYPNDNTSVRVPSSLTSPLLKSEPQTLGIPYLPYSSASQTNKSLQGVSTIYTSPGHPIIYPSQSLPHISPQDSRSYPNPQHKYSVPVYPEKDTTLYDHGRKTSLPALRASNLGGNYSRPVHIMDRKQAVYTIQNSLPLVSKCNAPVSLDEGMNQSIKQV